MNVRGSLGRAWVESSNECHPGPSHGFGEVIGIEHGERKALLEASGGRVVLVGGRELPDAKAGS